MLNLLCIELEEPCSLVLQSGRFNLNALWVCVPLFYFPFDLYCQLASSALVFFFSTLFHNGRKIWNQNYH